MHIKYNKKIKQKGSQKIKVSKKWLKSFSKTVWNTKRKPTATIPFPWNATALNRRLAQPGNNETRGARMAVPILAAPLVPCLEGLSLSVQWSMASPGLTGTKQARAQGQRHIIKIPSQLRGGRTKILQFSLFPFLHSIYHSQKDWIVCGENKFVLISKNIYTQKNLWKIVMEQWE